MIIRSADGESIVNFDNMSLVQMEPTDGKYKIVAYDTGASTATPLGEYSTYQQAHDVIIGIEGTYLASTASIDTGGDLFNPSHGYVAVATIYDMPDDAGKDYESDYDDEGED